VASVWLSRSGSTLVRHHSGGTAPDSTGFLFHETFGPHTRRAETMQDVEPAERLPVSRYGRRFDLLAHPASET
jgi:hypothetical protein